MIPSARAALQLAVPALLGISASCLMVAAACAAEPAPKAAAPPPVEELIVDVVSSHRHDPRAFTQGLVWSDGVLYESTGQYGESSVRRVDPESGEVLARVDLPRELFGEGLALVPGEGGARLIQLTWQEELARVWTVPGLEPAGTLRYRGEGWGLCFDGERLVMSDGSDLLTFRDPKSFEVTGRLQVTLRGEPLYRINELECADGWVWANVLGADFLVRIDPASGRVTGTADASGLLAPAEAAASDVLNGIAYDPARRVYLITGKYWPRLFVVRLLPAAGRKP
jgi:glutaminyl-peptide cyclotransferase